MIVYLLPGLGATERMFQPQEAVLKYDFRHIKYPVPTKNESIEDFVKRLSEQIDESQPFILLGVSFGGILSIELSKIVNPEKIVLVASVKQRKELPLWMRLGNHIPAQKLVSGKLIKKFFKQATLGLGSIDPEAFEVFQEMMDSYDDYYIEWAINTIAKWQNTSYPDNLYHIHGDWDRLFPIKKIENPIIIRRGTHVMNYTSAELVNNAIKEVIE